MHCRSSDITVPFEYSIGEEITLNNGTDKGTPFSKYEMVPITPVFRNRACPTRTTVLPYHEVTLSNKDKATVKWESTPKTMVGADNEHNIVVLFRNSRGNRDRR